MPIRCEIVSQDRMVFEGDADIVVLPGTDGEMGILPHHAPLLTTLKIGIVKSSGGGKKKSSPLLAVLPRSSRTLSPSWLMRRKTLKRSTWLAPKLPASTPKRSLPRVFLPIGFLLEDGSCFAQVQFAAGGCQTLPSRTCQTPPDHRLTRIEIIYACAVFIFQRPGDDIGTVRNADCRWQRHSGG